MKYLQQINPYKRINRSIMGVRKNTTMFFEVEYSPSENNGVTLGEFVATIREYPQGIMEVYSKDNAHIVGVAYDGWDITEEKVIEWVRDIFK